MVIQEYIADSKIGKKLYHEKRSHYKRYKIGMIIVWGLLLIMVLINLGLAWNAESTYQIVENLFVGIGFDMFFFVSMLLAQAVAISGGREILKSRLAEKCIFTDHYFILEYMPHVHETIAYNYIQFKIKYKDIKKVVDEDWLGRVAIYGTYTISKYCVLDSEKDMESYTVSDMPIYIYGYYKEYASLKKKLTELN